MDDIRRIRRQFLGTPRRAAGPPVQSTRQPAAADGGRQYRPWKRRRRVGSPAAALAASSWPLPRGAQQDGAIFLGDHSPDLFSLIHNLAYAPPCSHALPAYVSGFIRGQTQPSCRRGRPFSRPRPRWCQRRQPHAPQPSAAPILFEGNCRPAARDCDTARWVTNYCSAAAPSLCCGTSILMAYDGALSLTVSISYSLCERSSKALSMISRRCLPPRPDEWKPS